MAPPHPLPPTFHARPGEGATSPPPPPGLPRRRRRTARYRTGIGLVCLAVAACGSPGPPADRGEVVRLIPELPRRTLSPGALGEEVVVLPGAFGAGGWRPVTGTAGWRLEEGALVLPARGRPVDLVRSVELDAAEMHTLEVTLASATMVELELSWTRRGEAGREGRLTRDYNHGRGSQERRSFTFDLHAHPGWSGRIAELRLRLEPAGRDDEITVYRLTGSRIAVRPEILAERTREPWRVELDHELRSAFLVPPGSPIERRVTVPADGVLHFGYGATGRLAAPATLRVAAVTPDGGSTGLFETRFEPVDFGSSRTWRQARADLAAFAGRTLRLVAESSAGEGFDPALGLPAWASPEIVSGSPPETRPNVVLISIDTLRADRLSLHGDPRDATPHLDAWARRSAVSFRNTIAPAPWTLPSHGSLLTGLDAVTHGVNHPFRAVPDKLTTLAERLRDAGYFTAGLTGGGWLHPAYGLAQGYDRYRYWSAAGRGDEELAAHVARAARWLPELRRPFFLFLHTFDVHDYEQPHRAGAPAPGEDRAARAGALYDRAVAHMDGLLGWFLDDFEALGLRGRTLLALTSDHGEDLGEGGVFGHGSLRDQVLRVPLLVEFPDGRGAGTSVDRQVRTVDVLPTLLEVAGVAVPVGLDGGSLAETAGGSAAPSPVAVSYASAPLRGLSLRFRNRWKYVFDNSVWSAGYGRETLFRLPGETPTADLPEDERPGVENLRSLARRLLDERLAGLRMGFRNAGDSPWSGRIQGELVRLGALTSTDPPRGWIRRVSEDAAELTVPGGEEVRLLFERLGEPRLTLGARTGGDQARELATVTVELAELSFPAVFGWTGSAWQAGAAAAGTTVTIDWNGSAGLEEGAPFAELPELERQLEALGYL